MAKREELHVGKRQLDYEYSAGVMIEFCVNAEAGISSAAGDHISEVFSVAFISHAICE